MLNTDEKLVIMYSTNLVLLKDTMEAFKAIEDYTTTVEESNLCKANAKKLLGLTLMQECDKSINEIAS